MTVTIDTTRCIGCGMCEYTAPGENENELPLDPLV